MWILSPECIEAYRGRCRLLGFIIFTELLIYIIHRMCGWWVETISTLDTNEYDQLGSVQTPDGQLNKLDGDDALCVGALLPSILD